MGENFENFANALKDYLNDEEKQNEFLNSTSSINKSTDFTQDSETKPDVKFVKVASKYSIQDLFGTNDQKNKTGKINKVDAKIFQSNVLGEKEWSSSLPHFSEKNEAQAHPIPLQLSQDFKKLGLKNTATFEECKTAYKSLLKKYHPDIHIKNKDDYEKATKITASISESFNRIENWFLKNN